MSENRNLNKIKLISLLLILSLVLIIIIVNAVKLGVQTIYPRQYVELVEENAQAFEIDEALLYALIKSESGFDKNAVSSVGAKGLTQITPDTFQWLQTKTGDAYEEDKKETSLDDDVSFHNGRNDYISFSRLADSPYDSCYCGISCQHLRNKSYE